MEEEKRRGDHGHPPTPSNAPEITNDPHRGYPASLRLVAVFSPFSGENRRLADGLTDLLPATTPSALTTRRWIGQFLVPRPRPAVHLGKKQAIGNCFETSMSLYSQCRGWTNEAPDAAKAIESSTDGQTAGAEMKIGCACSSPAGHHGERNTQNTAHLPRRTRTPNPIRWMGAAEAATGANFMSGQIQRRFMASYLRVAPRRGTRALLFKSAALRAL